jgi:hypothetical protein
VNPDTANATTGLFAEMVCDVLGIGCCVRFRAQGWSMTPTIKETEKITVKPATPSEVRVGDIVLYRKGGKLTAHRVMKTGSRRFIVRGDALRDSDPPVEAAQILGKVVSVERAGRCVSLTGRAARFLHRARSRLSQIKRCLRFQRTRSTRGGMS